MDKKIHKDINKSCEALGVIDERTVRKHFLRFNACLNDFDINLSSIISQYGGQLPDKKPETGSMSDINIQWFGKLAASIISIREKLFGYENLSLKDIAAVYFFFLHSAYPCAKKNENSKNTGFQFF